MKNATVTVNGFTGTVVREFTIGSKNWVELVDEFDITHKFPKSKVKVV